MSKQKLLQTVFVLSSVLLAYGGYRLYPRTMPIYALNAAEFPPSRLIYKSGEPVKTTLFVCAGQGVCQIASKTDPLWMMEAVRWTNDDRICQVKITGQDYWYYCTRAR